jgi:catechol 2,3-dioxygenase-like lactoylglutathione lyase family enzyme
VNPLAKATPVIIVATRDRKISLPFYRDTLALPLKFEDGHAAVFDVGGAPLRLSTVPDWKPHAHTVFGFEVEDIAATVDALVGRGVKFERYPGFKHDERGVWTSPDGAAKVAWFLDPEGNNLSLAELR